MRTFKNRIFVISLITYLLLILTYIFLQLVQPVQLIDKFLHYSYNDPSKVNNIVYRLLGTVITASTFLILCFLFYSSQYFEKWIIHLKKFFSGLSAFLNLKTLSYISIIYTIFLFILAVIHYDLGFDEAWYLDWARNFASSGIAYNLVDDKIFLVDSITMLPFYVFSAVNFGLGLTEVWHFKLLSVLFSSITILVLVKTSVSLFNRQVASVFILLLLLQPGFGFIASSFFGEFLQSAFLFSAFYFWFQNPIVPNKKIVLITAILFTLAIHTKFQLLMILFITLLIFNFMDRKCKALSILGYTFLFTSLTAIIRILPVILTDISYTRDLLIVNYLLFQSITSSLNAVIFDKVQLLNRFYSVSFFVVVSVVFSIYVKKPVEKFIMLFSTISILWWVFLYPYVTYRHPFIGIITLCLMSAILINLFYENFIENRSSRKILFRYISAFGVLFLMLYGFSTNLIYAYIGYNDGVQFDLDGFNSRLFEKIERDNSQKEFYEEIKKTISREDTLYNGSFVAKFYLKNPIYTFEKMKRGLGNSYGEKYVLITRDMHPLGFETVHSKLDSLGCERKLVLKKHGHELYVIKRQKSPSP